MSERWTSGTALVIGASRGIGLALARELLGTDSGRRVVACSRSATREASLDALASAYPDRVLAVDLDVATEASVAAAASRVALRCESVDLLVNCAGVLHEGETLRPERRLADLDPDAAVRSYRINALGPALAAKHFQHLLPRGERAVFASLSARVGSIADNRLGGWYAYRAAKAAQNMITRNLSIELRRRHRGVICVGLHPGTVDTALSRPFQARVPPARLFEPEFAARALLQVIRGLRPEDSGGVFAWDGQRIPE